MNDAQILSDVKTQLGIQSDYTIFDGPILQDINGVFGVLNTLGVGPEESFVADSSTEWSSFTTDTVLLSLIKPYMYMRVRIIFDPPSSSYVLDAINKQLSEYEYRMYIVYDTNETTGTTEPASTST